MSDKIAERASWAGLIRLFLSLVLIIAAVLKLAYYVPELSFQFNEPLWFTLIGTIEAGIGLLALFNFRHSWTMVAVFFATTSIFGVTEMAKGQTACNCFGAIETPVIFSLILSVASFALLLFSFRRFQDDVPWNLDGQTVCLAVGFSFALFGVLRFTGGNDLQNIVAGRMLEAKVLMPEIELEYLDACSVAIPVEIANLSRTKTLSVIGLQSDS